MPELTDQELEYYGRHIMLERIGVEGQIRLKQAEVTLIGAGGTGCPTALYLASSGIGTLRIIDDDIVEFTNLQRQFLYRHSDINKPKALCLAAALREVNPAINIVPVSERATDASLPAHLHNSTVVIDGTDNFASRHVLNRVCHAKAINLVSGAAERWDGQVYTFAFGTVRQPCYNCLFPADMPVPPATSCALLGVFAPLTGLIGALMASEAIRILTAPQTTGLQSKMLAFDMRSMRTRVLTIKPEPQCKTCSSPA